MINASPYEVDKQTQREQLVVRERVREVGVPIVFCNLVGGQDELVFDGNSFVMDAQGVVTQRAPAFTEGMYVVDLGLDAAGAVHPIPGDLGAAAEPGGKRVRRAGAGHARLRHQAQVSRRRDGSVGRRRFRIDLGHRRRCARRRPRAFGGDALALHIANEQGRCRAAGEAAARQAQRDFHRGDVRGDAGGLEG